MGKCVFSAKWKANERFKAWIAADPKSRTKAKCTVCDRAIDISSMGEAALVSHIIVSRETQETYANQTGVIFRPARRIHWHGKWKVRIRISVIQSQT